MSAEAMRQGHDFEGYVAERWEEATGKKCVVDGHMWRSTEWPWMIADVDRLVEGENAALECKTTSVLNKHDFESGEIPLNYYVQCMHYMAVMGFDRMYLAVLVLGKAFYHFTIERNEDEIAALVEQERQFWELVENDTPPAPDGSDATLSAIGARFPAANAVEESVTLSEKALAMLRSIDEIDAQIKELTEAKKTAQAAVQLELQDYVYGDVGEYSVSWKPQKRTTVDTKRLKAELPEVYEQYTKTAESRVFRTKKKKEAEE